MGIRVIVIDDDQFVGKSLKTILDMQDDIQVIALGMSGPEAQQLYHTHHPDVLLMDIQMPEGDGLTAAEKILEKYPHARIVFLTTFSDDEYIVRALRIGARGYLIKQDVSNIAPALRSVCAGQSVLGKQVIDRVDVLMGVAASQNDLPQEIHNIPSLTERENQIVELIAQGLDNREIAARIYIGEGTVRNNISTILQKLNLKNRTQIAVHYYRAR